MKACARFEDFPPYTPIEPFEVLSDRLGIPVNQIVKLDANENPYGPSPAAITALSNLAYSHIYPDPESRALRHSLSDFTGVPVQYLLAGAGADELIDLLLRVIVEPGDWVINLPPTFGMYAFDARLNAAKVLDLPRRDDFSLDIPAIQQAVETHQPKVLFATSPNNPDGRLMTDEEFEFLIELPVLIVLDEAYIEFSDAHLGQTQSRIRQVTQRENLVVLRTFSKWAGLAGLRVGFGAFPVWLQPVLWKAKQPYNVNVAASTAAIASLQDQKILRERVSLLQMERQCLFESLGRIPYLQPYASQTNFILCKVHDQPAQKLRESLMQRGILVRHYDTALLKNYIRISVGRPNDTKRLLAALEELF